MAQVTCRTPGCLNEGVSISTDLSFPDPETGETVWVSGVSCGVCGKDITDIVDESTTGGAVTSFSSSDG